MNCKETDDSKQTDVTERFKKTSFTETSEQYSDTFVRICLHKIVCPSKYSLTKPEALIVENSTLTTPIKTNNALNTPLKPMSSSQKTNAKVIKVSRVNENEAFVQAKQTNGNVYNACELKTIEAKVY